MFRMQSGLSSAIHGCESKDACHNIQIYIYIYTYIYIYILTSAPLALDPFVCTHICNM